MEVVKVMNSACNIGRGGRERTFLDHC